MIQNDDPEQEVNNDADFESDNRDWFSENETNKLCMYYTVALGLLVLITYLGSKFFD